MDDNLVRLLDLARKSSMTPEQLEIQRQSFAYGNAKLANDLITRDSIKSAAQLLNGMVSNGNRKQDQAGSVSHSRRKG